MFRVGMKVVCVDDGVGPFMKEAGGIWDAPIKNKEIYTIRWCGEYTYVGPRGSITAPCVRLVGINRPDPLWGEEDRPFAASRFRPVVERKTDISIFNQILRDVTARERVRA